MVATTGSEGHFPQFEVGEELVPFGGGKLPVFLAGPLSATTGDERPVVCDHVLRANGSVSHGCVYCGMVADLRRDVRGQPGADGVGDKDPPKIVGPPFQGLAAGSDLGGL